MQKERRLICQLLAYFFLLEVCVAQNKKKKRFKQAISDKKKKIKSKVGILCSYSLVLLRTTSKKKVTAT